MTIPHALLALLATTPKFGLRLKEEFEASTGSMWPLNVGQVYATLQRLERDKFVEASEANEDVTSQKLYQLTDLGKAELDSWLRTPPNVSVPPRDEIVIKVMVALTIADYDVVSVIQSHRRQILQSMQSVTRMKKGSSTELALALVLDAELFRLEATSRWLDTCEARVRRAGPDHQGRAMLIPADEPAMADRQPDTNPSPKPTASTSRSLFAKGNVQ